MREYEMVSAEHTPENPLGIRVLTPECIRQLPEEELEEKRRAAEEERSQRFRELYEALDLRVVCHKDRSLEVTCGGSQCSVSRGRSEGCVQSVEDRVQLRVHCKTSREVVEADERTAEIEECLVDVGPPLVTHRKPPAARASQASVRSTTHRCLPSLSLVSLPLLAIRPFMPRSRRALRQRGKS